MALPLTSGRYPDSGPGLSQPGDLLWYLHGLHDSERDQMSDELPRAVVPPAAGSGMLSVRAQCEIPNLLVRCHGCW